MEPISTALLAALAGGAGGELGRQAWAWLGALARTPFRRSAGDSPDAPEPGSGEAELAGLEETPDDPARAHALSTALAVRAALDAQFRAELQRWHEQAKQAPTGGGDVRNTIGNGTFSAPVLQGRDFTGISFTSPHPPPDTPGTGAPSTRG
ncbi:hypothetical protein GQS52_25480 [Streptomyces sp. SCUT-3]|uniref:hypothetical protein n=1 Tax=Streptomyces TaxID=1883 RepID=UPI0015FBF674|nr:hypothetical protein [Streptomyces sp. SCUT-3]QMV24567.1 hypothetical protein GQS52_25480 [Streptomyces sp. SCUT-3]